MAINLAETVHGAVRILLALSGATLLSGTAIHVAGGTKSLIVQRSYEES